MSERTTYVPYEKEVTVYEHRSPTDQIIIFLKELEAAAKTKIVDSIIVEDNFVNGAVVAFVNDICHVQHTVHFMFKINGKTLRGKFEVSNRDFRGISLREILYKETENTIAKMLMSGYDEALHNMNYATS